MPDMTRPFEVLTDASSVAIGAALQQRDDDGHSYAVSFVSRLLIPAETRYHTQEQECLAIIFALQKFRTYLLGRHFTVFTDHHALLSVLTKASPSSRITRWSLLMQEFDFKIVHLPGELHRVPDALSRPELSMSITDTTTLENWIKEQHQDNFCSSVLRHIAIAHELGEDEVNGFKTLQSGLLVFKAEFDDRIVVPASLREPVLLHLHADVTAGHQGIKRTISRVAERYFWPKWRNDTTEFVKSCLSCQQRKGYQKIQRPVLHVMSRGANDLIAMDIQGPLNETAMGHKFILVIQDIFSKFVVVCPLRGTTAEKIAAALIQHWVGVFGCPTRLLTDNGSNFTSMTMNDVLILLKVQKLWTSPYRPQTDGSVERFNRTLNAMMSHYLDREQSNWDSFISLLALAYNSTFNPQIGTSPYSAFLSRVPPRLADWLLHVPHDVHSQGGGGETSTQSNTDGIISVSNRKEI
jgi:transposase InsO family protein